jgi:hypothetical protein
MKRSPEPEQTFEEVYPKYPFAELVRLSVSFAKLLARLRRRQSGKRPHTLSAGHTAAPRNVGRPVRSSSGRLGVGSVVKTASPAL